MSQSVAIFTLFRFFIRNLLILGQVQNPNQASNQTSWT
ncbi:hypothetical protein LEP1GSC040_3758 [Leptospira santarosai str. 2000030832]|nr:hypothetical protein LEP1GSC040_3758 [Leptospira santarosai str. 2000030832]